MGNTVSDFNSFSLPSDGCTINPTSYGYTYPDAALVGGNVLLYLSYANGPIRELFSREDGTLFSISPTKDTFPDAGTNGNYRTQGSFQGTSWFTQSQRGLSTISGDILRYVSGSIDCDNSVQVVAPTSGQAGLICRFSTNASYDLIVIDAASTHLKMYVRASSSNTLVFTGTTAFTPGVEYTLRAVAVGNTYTLYINGVSEGTINLTSGLQQTNNASGHTEHGLIWDTGSLFRTWVVARTADPAPTTVTVYNYDGTAVFTSALSAFADPSVLAIPDSSLMQRNSRGPYGWYMVELTGTDHGDGIWGTAYGDTAFARVPGSSLGAVPTPIHIFGTAQNSNAYPAERMFGLGVGRIVIDPSVTPATTIAALAPDLTLISTYVTSATSPLRPSQPFVAFSNGTFSYETNITTIVNGLKSAIHVWEGRNEPQAFYGNTFQRGIDYFTSEWLPFYNAVLAADATALVIGPGVVSYDAGDRGLFFDGFVSAFAAAGHPANGAWSFHAYNTYNGDLTMTRRNLGAVVSLVGSP